MSVNLNPSIVITPATPAVLETARQIPLERKNAMCSAQFKKVMEMPAYIDPMGKIEDITPENKV